MYCYIKYVNDIILMFLYYNMKECVNIINTIQHYISLGQIFYDLVDNDFYNTV